jgi:hypothetical protein
MLFQFQVAQPFGAGEIKENVKLGGETRSFIRQLLPDAREMRVTAPCKTQKFISRVVPHISSIDHTFQMAALRK